LSKFSANFRHGGDLSGIIDRLDYLKDLGINSLWITPIFQHNGSYHGYCTTDFYKVDPGFGTPELFRELVSKAHQRGIRVILDIVINHICDPKTKYDNNAISYFDHLQCAQDLDNSNWSGGPSSSIHQGHLNLSQDFFKYFKFEKFFNRCGANSTSDMQGTGPAAIYGDFVSTMFDFNTRDPDFQELFAEILKYWIAYSDLDGFRFDAAKHVSEDYIAYLSTQVRDFAHQIGKNNFFIVGEVAGPSDWIGRRLGRMYLNPEKPKTEHGNVPQSLIDILENNLKSIYLKHSLFPLPGLNAVYDLSHGGNALAVLHNSSPSQNLEDHFNGNYYQDISGQADPRLSWNLVEIHDWPRFSSYNPNSIEKSKLATAYLALAEGSPIIYYGLEQGFNGKCPTAPNTLIPEMQRACATHEGDAFYRQDMFITGPFRLGSTVPEIQKLSGFLSKTEAGNFSTESQRDPFINQNHDLYRSTRKFLHLRQSCKALKFGRTRFRWTERSNDGLLAFSRIDFLASHSDPEREILVIINTGSTPRQLPRMRIQSQTGSASQIWINLLNGYQKAKIISFNQNSEDHSELALEHITISGNSIMVFAPNEAIGPYNKEMDVHFCL
jgi:glycosidase